MSIRGVVIDVDGTVLRGDDPVPGAREGVDRLARAGVRRLFFSNNPTKAPPAYRDRLVRAGFDVATEEVVTSGTTAVAYLNDHHPDADAFVVGEAGLRTQLSEAGVPVVDDPDAAEVVVVSIDREFTYDDLAEAMWALEGGTPFVGTDPDMVIPAADRDVPGSGAIVTAVAGVAGRDPEVVLGKPSRPARRLVRDRLGLPREECLVVGDRLDTDVALGARAGMRTALVLTGIASRADLADADVEPDHVLDSLAEVGDVL
ncbi:MAG: HAD-IIA family hydrolase [Haloferacaceae archaeon]